MANTIRIKRRATGAVGAPTALANAELAFNEVDNTLYYGKGTGGAAGTATTVDAIGGSGAFVNLTGVQTISGAKTLSANNTFSGDNTFTGINTFPTQTLSDNSTRAATTAFIKGQSYVVGNTAFTAGTYKSVTVDTKGLITAGTNPTTLSGFGITDAQALDADLTAIAALAGTSGLLKKTAVDTWGLDTSTYLTGNQSISFTGDATGSGTTAVTLTLATVAVAGTYPKVTVNAKGLVTSGTNLIATDIPTLTASKISDFDTQVRTNRLDQLTLPNATVSMNGYKITALADPTAAQDAATKAYVDATRQGLSVKDAVRAATTASNITLSGLQTIDSVALAANDRVLVKNQTIQSENGIYAASAGSWARTSDADANTAEITGGTFLFVQEGTLNADTGWVCTTDGVVLVGTTALSFTQFSGAGQIIAGAGLTKTGNSIDAVGTASRITVNADSIDISSSYAGQATITTLGAINTGVWSATTVAVAYGGTGVTTSTGTGSVVLNTSPALTTPTITTPTLITPVLGTPSSGNFSSGTFTWPTFNQNTSGTAAGLSATLAVGSGGTGATTFTSKGILYGNGTSALGITNAGTWDATNSIGTLLSIDVSGVPVWTNEINGGTY